MESYLESVTRRLTGSDGVEHEVTLFNMHWITFDAVRLNQVYSEADMIDKAVEIAREENIDIHAAMERYLTLIDHELRRINGR